MYEAPVLMNSKSQKYGMKVTTLLHDAQLNIFIMDTHQMKALIQARARIPVIMSLDGYDLAAQ